ncbi:Uncharacterised protein [uncultured archaeon]|nr:Uncharacterised protein [uncultured archaeon]
MSKILEKIASALQIPFKEKIKAVEEDKKEELPEIDVKIPVKTKSEIKEEQRRKKIIKLRKKEEEFNTMVQDVLAQNKKAEKQENTTETTKTVEEKKTDKPKQTELKNQLKEINEKPGQPLFETKTTDTKPTKEDILASNMKKKCPNCHKETLKTYDCPYCNKEFCVKCAKSIDITEEGFEYKCPNCNKRIFVPK